MAIHSNNWGGLNAEDNKTHDALYDMYVPACGKASTVGGEILRAINRIVYKFYNDGDTVARYYSSSYNHSYGAEKYLRLHVPSYIPMREIDDDTEFEEYACFNLKRVLDYLKENPQLFKTENFEDFLDMSPEEEWPEEDYYEDDEDDCDEE